MEDLTLSELRDLYPEIKATSKKKFMELVAETLEVVESIEPIEEVVLKEVTDELTWYNIVEYITSQAKSNKKILIKTESSFDADFLFQHLKEKLFPLLEESGTVLMASSTRRDMHINGSCYVRLVCQANYTHIKRLIAYNTFKDIKN